MTVEFPVTIGGHAGERFIVDPRELTALEFLWLSLEFNPFELVKAFLRAHCQPLLDPTLSKLPFKLLRKLRIIGQSQGSLRLQTHLAVTWYSGTCSRSCQSLSIDRLTIVKSYQIRTLNPFPFLPTTHLDLKRPVHRVRLARRP